MTLCTNMWLLILRSRGTIPIGPKVLPLTMLTFKGFLVTSTLSMIFWNRWCDIHGHVACVSNRAVVHSLLRCLTAKFKSFNFGIFYVGYHMYFVLVKIHIWSFCAISVACVTFIWYFWYLSKTTLSYRITFFSPIIKLISMSLTCIGLTETESG